MTDFLKSQGVSPALIRGVEAYRAKYPWQDTSRPIVAPRYHYYGKEIWEAAIAALLSGTHLLLAGPKATGKNVLAENLAAVFGRPDWNVSFHINMDASYMIGMDTFIDGRVQFRPGPVWQCAKLGGFGILDEINMARNEALAVLHSLLDFRRILDVPGYERLTLHPASRFIATMNYGYAGTRELNEALASRFVVLHLPPISESSLDNLLASEFPTLSKQYRRTFGALFQDLAIKCDNGEVSTKAVDLRGLLDALTLMHTGLPAKTALAMGISGKVFDEDERALIDDVITLRLPDEPKPAELFEE